MLPARVKGPGREEEVEVEGPSGFSLRSLPELLRLLGGETGSGVRRLCHASHDDAASIPPPQGSPGVQV